jgi:hypothetical protein
MSKYTDEDFYIMEAKYSEQLRLNMEMVKVLHAVRWQAITGLPQNSRELKTIESLVNEALHL